MARRCSHCSHNGHNSRTCPNRGVKLFGVRLTDGLIQKSASMGNLTHCAGSLHGGAGHGDHHDAAGDMPDHGGDGYASEDFVPGSSSSRERKKGVPWTEEEHRMFLLGLQKLGKGDWRGISRNYVMSRTPTQVASHAQKYFIRRSNASRRKRRSSLFDIAVDESGDTLMACNDLFDVKHPQAERQTNNPLPAPPVLDKESESTDSANSIDVESAPQKLDTLQYCYPVVFPGYQLLPFPVPFWPGLPGQSMERAESETHEVLKPTAVHSKNPINVDELVGMSKLSLGECLGDANLSSPLSLKLVQGSTRHSAFRANHANMSSRVNSSSSPVHAV